MSRWYRWAIRIEINFADDVTALDLENVKVNDATVLTGNGLFLNHEGARHKTASRHRLGGTEHPPGANCFERTSCSASRLVRLDWHKESGRTLSKASRGAKKLMYAAASWRLKASYARSTTRSGRVSPGACAVAVVGKSTVSVRSTR